MKIQHFFILRYDYFYLINETNAHEEIHFSIVLFFILKIMIKKYSLLIIGLLFCVQMAQSQVLLSLLFGDNLNTPKLEFGLSAGFNHSYIRGINGSEGMNNFELGFYFDYLIKENSPWYIATGVFVKSNVGGTNIPLDYPGNRVVNDSIYNGFVAADGTVEKKFNTFYVPINARYLSKSGIFFDAGLQIGLVFKTFDTYTAEVDDYYLKYEVEKSIAGNDLYSWFDGGIDGGIGYKSKGSLGWKVGVYYYLGLTSIYKKDIDLNAYNSSLYVLANIPIGKKKASKSRAEKAGIKSTE